MLENYRALHLLGCKSNEISTHLLIREFRSACSSILGLQKTLKVCKQEKASDRSFTNIRKSKGPSTLPWRIH